MLHWQSFDLGGLLLTKGFALDLGPGFATVVGLTLSLGLRLLAIGKRGSGWLASGRKCRHKRPPQNPGEEIDGHAARQYAGEVAVTNHKSLLQTGTTRCREGVTGSRSPMMRPKTLPDSQSHTGKTRRSLNHHWRAESRHTPPKLRIARPGSFVMAFSASENKRSHRPHQHVSAIGLRQHGHSPLMSAKNAHVVTIARDLVREGDPPESGLPTPEGEQKKFSRCPVAPIFG